jgi:hypothetical protein
MSVPCQKLLWRRTLRQLSQKDWTTWERIKRLANDWLPKPRILHQWPESRFAVRHPILLLSYLGSNNSRWMLFQPCVLLLKRFDGSLRQQHVGRLAGENRQRTRW